MGGEGKKLPIGLGVCSGGNPLQSSIIKHNSFPIRSPLCLIVLTPVHGSGVPCGVLFKTISNSRPRVFRSGTGGFVEAEVYQLIHIYHILLGFS